MKIIISPAKKMRVGSSFTSLSAPVFESRADEIAAFLKEKTVPEIQEIMRTSEKIALDTFIFYDEFFDERNVSSAIESYDGIQFRHIHLDRFSDESLIYLNDTLRILSGLYGILKPFDKIRRYRLEMGLRFDYNGSENLYDYWSDAIYREVFKEGDTLINLASNEYSKAVLKYATPLDSVVNIDFKENVKGRMKTIATHAKILRGEMVSYMCMNKVENTGDLRSFKYDGFAFSHETRTSKGLTMTFTKDEG